MRGVTNLETTAMHPPQQEIVKMGLLNGPFSCVLHMPTGSGKTWLAQQAILATVKDGARAIYLTPLRALATEVASRWSHTMEGGAVGVFTGDYGPHGKVFPVPFNEARVLVMTPERLDACTRSWRSHWNWIPEVDLLVVDEIHLLSEKNRGPRLEGALSRFRRLNPFCRLMGLSATLGNPEELADWLDGVAYRSQWRPIPLEWRIAYFRKATEKPSVLQQEVARNVGVGGKSLVFVQSRRRAEELSRFLADTGIRANHHHAGLPHDQRRATETALRTGNVDVLVATGTLEMGLNLPVRQVVLYDLQTFDGHEFVPLSTNSVWQRVGRAGRPGLDERGEAVLLCPNWDKTAQRYQAGRFEFVQSQIGGSAALAEQIVAEVASGSAITRPQLQRALRQSLGGHQRIVSDLDSMVSTMCDAGMILETNDSDRPRTGLVLKATKAGRVAVRHMLMPETILTLQRTIRKFHDLTYLDVLIAIASVQDCEPVLAVDFEELDSLAAAVAAEPSYFLNLPLSELRQTLSISSRRLLSAVKMAHVMRIWTRTGDAGQSAEATDCYPFEVTRLAESMGRLLQATRELLAVGGENPNTSPQVDDEPTQLERIETLQTMVSFGLDEGAATLCFVPGIGGTFAKRLVGHGIMDIEELAAMEPEDLAGLKGLSLRRAQQWIDHAAGMIKTQHGLRLRDSGPRTPAARITWPHGIDPYRLRRALDLHVTQLSSNEYRITGGLEPHQVMVENKSIRCDCMDHQRGNHCKHILAVRKFQKDRAILRLLKALSKEPETLGLDLLQLWLTQDRVSSGTKFA